MRKIEILDGPDGAVVRRCRRPEGREGADHWREGWSEDMAPDFAPQIGPNRVSGLPAGASVLVKLVRYPVTDGAVRLRVRWAEDVHVKVIPAPGVEPIVLHVSCDPADNPPDGDGIDVRQDVQRLRLAAYPDLGEFADAFVKGGDVLEAYRAKCLAVKARFPK